MNFFIFDSLLESVLVINENSELVYGNAIASQLFDLSQKRLQSGKPLSDMVTFSEATPFSPEVLKALTGPSAWVETKFQSKSGKDGLVQITVQPVDDKFYLVYFRDVTLEQTLQAKYRAELVQKEKYIGELEIAQAELEKYSKNLEQLVQARTAELREANQLLKAILDALGEGFLVFNRTGMCLPVFSKICTEILETIPHGKLIEDVLKVEAADLPSFKFWREGLFDEPIPFEDLKALGPHEFAHSKGMRVELDFEPMRDENGKIEGIVVIAANKTKEFEARQEAQRERANSQMILKIVRSRPQFMRFLAEADNLVQFIEQEVSRPQVNTVALAHHLHTLKGGAGTFSLKVVHDHAHGTEEDLLKYQSAQDLAEKRKVLEQVVSGCKQLQVDLENFRKENAALFTGAHMDGQKRVEVEIDRLVEWSKQQATATLTREIMDAASESILSQVSHYNDVAIETATTLGKKLNSVVFKNCEYKVFVTPYEDVFNSLVHVFRNAIDHGLESPEERMSHGKPEAGTISVSVEVKGSRLILRIQDDGRGVAPSIIREKLKEKGYTAAQVDKETDHEVIQHIFDDQFSTRTEVTDLSGRGVGLGAVRAAVHTIGGIVEVKSSLGKGTEFVIDLPVITPLDYSTTKKKSA